MPFAYYAQLSPEQRLVYQLSDRAVAVRLRSPRGLRPPIEAVRVALASGDRAALERAAAWLCREVTSALGVPPVAVEVLETRPHSADGELHGLYSVRPEGGPRIRVWMRTAKRGRVVAFRTFLRTVLHELCHHLDFTLLELPISFHTEGFFRRESSLFHQLVPEWARPG